MNFMSACMAVFGCIIGLLIGEASEDVVIYFLPIVAGQFLFVSLTHLLPELLKVEKPRSRLAACASVLLGVGIIASLLLLPDDFGHSH